ncbi:MAG: hypothetical protein QF535_13400 [Anaerolineales bacterium]|nr:hypothetical protein [Anaerolineales bacterium]
MSPVTDPSLLKPSTTDPKVFSYFLYADSLAGNYNEWVEEILLGLDND